MFTLMVEGFTLLVLNLYTEAYFVVNAKCRRESCGIIRLLSSNDQGQCFVWMKQTSISYIDKRLFTQNVIQTNSRNTYILSLTHIST